VQQRRFSARRLRSTKRAVRYRCGILAPHRKRHLPVPRVVDSVRRSDVADHLNFPRRWRNSQPGQNVAHFGGAHGGDVSLFGEYLSLGKLRRAAESSDLGFRCFVEIEEIEGQPLDSLAPRIPRLSRLPQAVPPSSVCFSRHTVSNHCHLESGCSIRGLLKSRDSL
jgi:hypothetical protein